MDNNLTIALKAIEYVTSAPLFWGSMGFTTALSMFIGAMIYNGDLSQAKKTIFSILSYAFILSQVTITRILNTYSNPLLSKGQVQHPEMAFAGITTLIFLTVFWSLGLFLGVFILSLKKQRGV